VSTVLLNEYMDEYMEVKFKTNNKSTNNNYFALSFVFTKHFKIIATHSNALF